MENRRVARMRAVVAKAGLVTEENTEFLFVTDGKTKIVYDKEDIEDGLVSARIILADFRFFGDYED